MTATKKDYCTQKSVADCSICSLANYGRDCQNNPIEPDPRETAREKIDNSIRLFQSIRGDLLEGCGTFPELQHAENDQLIEWLIEAADTSGEMINAVRNELLTYRKNLGPKKTIIPKLDDSIIGKVVTFETDLGEVDGYQGRQKYHLLITKVDFSEDTIEGEILEDLKSGDAEDKKIGIPIVGILQDGAEIMNLQQYDDYAAILTALQ